MLLNSLLKVKEENMDHTQLKDQSLDSVDKSFTATKRFGIDENENLPI